MSFYQSISEYYSRIFPLNPGQSHFVKDVLPGSGNLSILDVGCGTGELALELASEFKKVVGIDLDGAMLERARAAPKAHENVEFVRMDMLDIGTGFGPGAFDAIVCFGNTLVHLQTPGQILSFLVQCGQVTASGGRLLIQVINYDRILDQEIDALPTIETPEIKFVRNYHRHADRPLIEFETILTVKNTKRSLRNMIPLYPLRKSEIEHLLQQAGFRDVKFYGGFNRIALDSGSQALVIDARKPS